MASSDLPQPKIIGGNKSDINDKWAEFIIRINNLKKSRDTVTIFYPNDSCLVVRINDNDVMTRPLPAPVQIEECKYKVKYKEKGEIIIKLRKVQPGKWLDRWSPRRELQQHVSNSSSLPALPAPPGAPTSPVLEECIQCDVAQLQLAQPYTVIEPDSD